jgi:hypothetical protein
MSTLRAILDLRPVAVLLALLCVLTLLGCDTELSARGAGERDEAPLWADPGVIRLDGARTEVALAIHNVSGTVRPVGEFELGGEDWATLRFLDDSLPRSVPANEAVVVRLALSPASLLIEPGVYRSGAAVLRFASDQHRFEVPIEFVGSHAARSEAPPAWLAIMALLAITGAALLIPTRGSPSPSLTTRLISPSAAPPAAARWLGVGAISALLLVVAMIPVGAGVCRGRLGARVGPIELAGCREGLGGFELAMLSPAPGAWWLIIALTVAAAALATVRVRLRQRPTIDEAAVALAIVRVVGFALILAAMLTGLAVSGGSITALVQAQLRTTELGGLTLPAWGLIAQPLAGIAAVALAIPARSTIGSEPLLAALERLERLIAAALITTVFLAGWSIPGLSGRAVPVLAHAPTLALELLAFAAKLALVDLVLTRLGALLIAREVTALTLVRAHLRWTIPLALLNLLAVLLWWAV